MIGYFPSPYPDELFYSLCARFGDRMQYPIHVAVLLDLFGSGKTTAVVDLPNRLEAFVDGLPPGHAYTVDGVIDKHTILPFFSPFLPKERIKCIRECMRENLRGGRNPYSYITRSPLLPPDALRFCPVCVEADRERFGECYWHRVHQLAGVEVCPTHHVWLEESNVLARCKVSLVEFASAERSVHDVIPRNLDLSEPGSQILLYIATESAWLLEQRDFAPGLESLSGRYVVALVRQGLASHAGKIHGDQFLQKLVDCYPLDLLEKFHCKLRWPNNGFWFSGMIHGFRIHHPIHHLLLVRCLGYTLEEFFQLPAEYRPFGQGPWPCLNPCCEHYMQASIEQCHITTHTGRPLGVFACACGFVYTRTGPDRTPDDRFHRNTSPRAYGHVWEAALKEMWHDPNLTLREITRRLDIDWATVYRQAARLGLSLPRPGAWPGSKQVARRSEYERKQLLYADKVETYRAEWLSAMEENPDDGVTALLDRFRRVYSWLAKYDAEWFELHKPPRSEQTCSHRKDWASHDETYAEEVNKAAEHIKDMPGRPRRVTKSMIFRLMRKGNLYRDLDKLPLTSQVLSEVLETDQDVVVRKIWWAAEQYCQERILPTRYKLQRRAGIDSRSRDLAELPRVKKAIDDALEMISQLGRSPGEDV